jgi:hypothetical protein
LKQHNQFALLGQRRFAPFFVTQLLGAFNDNVFRNATLVLNTALMGLSQETAVDLHEPGAGAVHPALLLFLGHRRQLARKYEKTRIIRAVKLFEIGAMAIAAYGFYATTPACCWWCCS